MENNDWCFAWIPEALDPTGANRQALIGDLKWKSGDQITVSFLDDDHNLKDKAEAIAEQWTASDAANLQLIFLDDVNTMIRISFRKPGNWSVIGKACLNVPPGEPTMNFGGLNADSTDDRIRRVVLHEFGHALGLIHEHQVPENGIQWNRERVVADLKAQWTPEQIEQNMFRPFDVGEGNYAEFDKKSIMLYPIPPEWTNGTFSVGWNTQLSHGDKEFVNSKYR